MPILNTQDILSGASALERIENYESRRTPDAVHLQQIVEAATIFNKAMDGNPLAQFELREAFSQSDFPILLGQGFEIEMLARYEEIAPAWQAWVSRTLVRDFKPKKYVDFFGGRSSFDRVAEGEEYMAKSRDEAEYSIQAHKYGNIFKLTFELIKSAEYDTLAQLPDDLAAGARFTEDEQATRMLVSEAGVNTNFFNSDNGNAVDNKPLNRANLKAALQKLAKSKGPDGRTINMLAGVNLLVPTSLSLDAEEMVSATTIEVTNGSEKSTIRNAITGKVTPIVVPGLEEIDQSSTASTTWFLAPKKEVARPAFAIAFMRGQENPDIRVKADTGQRVGGGTIGADEGSFNDDTVVYRGRHILGTATLHAAHTYTSKGA